MTKAFHAVDRKFLKQTLGTGYGAALLIPIGAISAAVTLSDSAIAFTVQDQATLTPEESVPAGASYVLGNENYPLGTAVSIKVKAASGTPVATVSWFEHTQP
jgi:hypothetical protein